MFGRVRKTECLREKSKTRREDKYKFITYILNKMKLPTEHRKTGKKNEERRLKRKAPRDLGPEDTIVHTRGEGPTVLLCGDSKVACKWIKVEFAQRNKVQRDNWENSKNLTLMVEKEEQPHRSRTSTTS